MNRPKGKNGIPKVINPFVAGRHVLDDDFAVTSREKLANHIYETLKDSNVILKGERNVGKTSLIKYVGNSAEKDNVLFCYLQAQDRRSLDDLFSDESGLIRALNFRLEDTPMQSIEYSTLEKTLDKIDSELSEQDRRLIFAVDEAGVPLVYAHDKQTLKKITSAAQTTENIKWLLQLHNHDYETIIDSIPNAKSCFRKYKEIEVGPFSKEDIAELFEAYAGNYLTFPENVIKRIHKVTKGVPVLCQYVGKKIFDKYETEIEIGEKPTVTIEDVDKYHDVRDNQTGLWARLGR